MRGVNYGKATKPWPKAAIRAGVEAYFGYPITPQTELLEWMAQRMPELGRAFVQAESEVAAINMVYGAACTGVRGDELFLQPGRQPDDGRPSYIAGTELPVVLIDVMRGGPGLGNIAPSQGDYNQIVHGGGHGDYHPIVLAPSSVQEAIDLTVLAFDLAEKYRSIVHCPGRRQHRPDDGTGRAAADAAARRTDLPDWAVRGAEGRERRILSSIYIKPEEEEVTNLRLLERWQKIEANEVRYQEYYLDDAEIVVVGFGTAGRVAFSAVRGARARASRSACSARSRSAPSRMQQLSRAGQERQGDPGGRDEHRPDAGRCAARRRRAHPGRVLRAHGRHGALPG